MDNPKKLSALDFEGEFSDLTHPRDFEFVIKKLQ
jgi:hypothetical protein